MELTEVVYTSLKKQEDCRQNISLKDVVRESCGYKNYLRFIQEEPGKEARAEKILRDKIAAKFKGKVTEYLKDNYGDAFTPGGVGKLNDVVDVEITGFLGDYLVEVEVISAGAFDGSAAKGVVPLWARVTAATKAHITKKKKVLLILVNRNNQNWCSFSISGELSEIYREVSEDVEDLKALIEGRGSHKGDESSCSMCTYSKPCMADKQPKKAAYTASFLRVSPSADLCTQLDQYLWSLNSRDSGRSNKCIHPSEFSISECDRRIAYELLGVERKEAISAHLRRIFDYGHACHDVIQETFKESLGDRCEIEVPVRHEALKIKGSCDGVLDKVHGQEIKSISSKGFEKLSSPKKEHQKQGTLYGFPLGLKDVTYLYVNKDTGSLQEYVVPVSKPLWHRMAARAESILRELDRESMPVRITKDYLCKSCPFTWKCRPELRRTG